MKRILVPLDGSDFAEQALSAAQALAIRSGAEIHLLSVASPEPPVQFPFADDAELTGWVDEELARSQGYLEQAAARLAARSAELRVETCVKVGAVVATIGRVAEDLDACLVILTTHGRGAFQRAWLGSTADQLLRSPGRPLLLLPPTPAGVRPLAEDGVRHVLVPLDGSDAAEAALGLLPLLVPASGAVRLTLASVVEGGFPLPADELPDEASEESVREEPGKRAAAYLAAAARRVEHEGIGKPNTRVLRADSAARGLLHYCKESAVDVIALSTHGRGGVSRFLLGSVADKLVRGAEVPVLVIRRPSDGRP